MGRSSNYTERTGYENGQNSPNGEAQSFKKGRALRFLVADDYELNRIVISASLEKLGCDSQGAVDGQQAFELFSSEDFDAVLMDNRMPVENGIDVTRRIRALKTKKNSIPIIGLTASEDETDHAAMLNAGMTAVYTKPLREADFRSILNTYLGKLETDGKS